MGKETLTLDEKRKKYEEVAKSSGLPAEALNMMYLTLDEEKQAEEIEIKTRILRTEDSKGNHIIEGLRSRCEKGDAPAIIPTGFTYLDNLLDGGLYTGLYIIGAISSLGKTSFCVQLADQIAQSGTPVLFFSLEMSKEEIIAKILSRKTYRGSLEKYRKFNYAKTTRGILKTHKYKEYEAEEKGLIDEAMKDLEQYGQNLYIVEGLGDISISDIDEYIKCVRKIRRCDGEISEDKITPVVIIDYLQILAPYNEHYTDKQNTDKAVSDLKRLSRDRNIPVLCISSFNRESYTAPVNLSCFKESGAIEYSSDVLIGLQYDGMDYQESENEASRLKRIRELIKDQLQQASTGRPQDIQLKILKNRNGGRGNILYKFVSMFNSFEEIEEE